MSKEKVESKKLMDESLDELVRSKDSLTLKEMQHRLQVLSRVDGESSIVTATWKKSSLPIKMNTIYLLSRIHDGFMVFGSANDQLYVCYCDSETDSWTYKKLDAPELAEQQMHSGKYVFDEDLQRIYFIYASQDDRQLKVKCLSLPTSSWLVLESSTHECLPWCQASFVLYQSNIYCFGGLLPSMKKSSHLMKFDTTTMTWEHVPLPRTSVKPCPRTLSLLHAHEDKLYLIGGMNEDQEFQKDVFVYNPDIGFGLLTDNLPISANDYHMTMISSSTHESIMCFYNHMTQFKWFDDKSTPLDFSVPDELVYPNEDTFVFDNCLFATKSNLYYLEDMCCLDDSEASEENRKEILQRIEMEQYVDDTFSKTFGRDLGILFMDGFLAKLASLFRSIDIRKFGIAIILLASIVYFVVIAVGCYLMVYINWLGVIGTTTYGVMGLLSYVTLICQLYIQSKQKVYLSSTLSYRNRQTYVAVVCLAFISILLLLSGTGTMFALTNITNETDRVGIMLITFILFVGLIINSLRLAINLLWPPSRSTNKFVSFVNRPWFPHFFKYPIYLICWAEIG
eukprot:CAMPEP_0117433472 /NCGR_PEP_ID=MMETSP0758-20121206/12842_1 /TAXON_ID=63605 /ORGANISM="Percolomonas cosmopolitus, Strain AE-1 (ATCC 50343)" /LENGTH=565 /DNA_ID=CAMNT_0005224187 /DNA_START=3606 /DNA_END=5299 /DNA_ORIENTATION=+